MISLATVYPGASPQDMDTLVTDKLYQEIKNIKGIDKINSTSGKGFSSILITLKTNANDRDVLNDVRNNIARAVLPTDAKDPVVTSIDVDTQMAFSLTLYADDPAVTQAQLFDKAKTLKSSLEKLPTVNTVVLGSSAMANSSVSVGGASDDSAYEVQLIIPEEALEARGLTLAGIASTIQSYNMDFPIGNFSIDGRSYDYRIEGKKKTSFDFLEIPIALPGGGSIKLADIAQIERKYLKEGEDHIYIADKQRSYNSVGLTINKTDSASIFAVADESKAEIEKIFQTPEFAGYHFAYTYDLAEANIEDYNTLFHEAFVTITLVFITMVIFVGFSDSIFATFTLPLAYLSTFIVLNAGGYSMNFLTNFSLILSFGIAIDTIIVIVQAASTKIRVGYEPRTAIMLALREYASPIAAGVSCTIVVFLPLIFLPGIMGKFMAFIPVTIVGVLASGLILVLTVNSALYLLTVRSKKTYIDIEHATEYSSDEEKELLALQREGKTLVTDEKVPLRNRVINKTIEEYKKILSTFLKNTTLRRISIALPVVFFIAGIMIFPPLIGFSLFPTDDMDTVSISIKGPVGMDTKSLTADIGDLTGLFADIPEVKHATLSLKNNTASVEVELYKKEQRKKLGQRSIFDIDTVLLSRLSSYEQRGFTVESALASAGPPGGDGVIGINLIADDQESLGDLIRVAKDFEAHLSSIAGTRNVKSSSEDTPGQFIFSLKTDRLAAHNIPASLIYGRISQYVNGMKVGTISDNGSDRDIVLKNFPQDATISTDVLLSLPLTVGPTTYRMGDFIEVKPSNAIQYINRTNGDIQIKVTSDVEPGANAANINTELSNYAASYAFPTGIHSSTGGENAENADFLIALVMSFILAIIVIFGILTYQFNNFSQPLVVYYSVLMATPFVLLGLWLTNNQLSVPMAIGFISFTGVAANPGIILIDAINLNLSKGMDGFTALVEA